MSPVRLDFQICNADLDDTSTHLLKYHSLALFGEDTRHGMPDVLPPDAIALMPNFVGSLKVIRAIDSWPDKLTYPLTYPDPDGEFFGYDINGIRLNDYPLDDYIHGTRTLIRNLISGAELLVRMRVDCHLVSREHVIVSYDEHVGDEWASILKEAVEQCRSTWLYQIPQRKVDRCYLRQLCQKTLSFENRIVHDCRLHLQKLLRSDSEVKLLHAIRATAESVLADKQARSALNALVEDTRSEIRRAAMESLSQLEDQ
jgi:hypothetical protein